MLASGPVGGFVVARVGELVGLGAVGEHGPDLARAAASGLEDDVAAVGSPGGAFVAAGIAGDFDGFVGGRGSIHDVDVVIARGTTPGEGKKLTVGRPGGVDDVAHIGKFDLTRIGAVGVHEIELRNAAAIADEGDELTGFGIPSRGSVCAIGSEGEALGTIAAGVGDVESGIALHRGREHDLRAVGRPGGRVVGATITSEGDELVGVEGIHADLRADDAADGNETGEGNA